MAGIIIFIVIVLFLILLKWMWHSLGNIEKSKKCVCIVGGLVITYIVTFIIYCISKIRITYENKETMKLIQTVFVGLFTILNSYLILPYVFKKIEQIKNGEIDEVKLQKIIIILIVIIFIISIFEILYLGNIQQGILSMINRGS